MKSVPFPILYLKDKWTVFIRLMFLVDIVDPLVDFIVYYIRGCPSLCVCVKLLSRDPLVFCFVF